MSIRRHLLALAPVIGLAAVAGVANAQAPGGAPAGSTVVSSGIPARDTLNRMLKPVTGEFKDQRLEDALKYIAELTGADIEPLWTDEQFTTGLDKEKQITLKFNGLTALKLMERVLEKASDEGASGGAATWQLTEGGGMQVGPKSRLNKYKRVEIYDINDLLLVVPDYLNAPQFDLQSVLQSNGGGGGGRSPFRDNNQNSQNKGPGGVDHLTRDDRAKELQKLISDLVDTEQWLDNGGEGGSIRYYQGSFIINAADYLHRQINGYPFWPQRQTTYGSVGGRRYVSFNGTTSINKLDGFTPHAITGTVGGPPGGGG